MKRILAALFLSVVTAGFVAAQSDDSTPGTASAPGIITPDTVTTVYAKLGMLTSVTLLTDKPVESVMRGGPEINLIKDKNVIHIQPAVVEGVSSINFRVEGITYVMRVRITQVEPVNPNPVYTFVKAAKFSDLDQVIANAPAMKPSDIDINGLVKVIERAEFDKAFRDTLHNYAIMPVNKTYVWNQCDIHFLQAYQFADLDLILFKISWVNTQTNAFYLHANQYNLFIHDRPITIQARKQLAPRYIVFPGQEEVVWLAVQGYKLRIDNDWDLRLPPDAENLKAYVRY